MNPLIRWFKNLRQTLSAQPGSAGGWRYLFINTRTQAGVNVNHDNALMFAPVWGCVRIISETLAMLPCHLYERQRSDGDGPEKNVMRWDHPTDWLISTQPNPEMDAGVFWETLLAHCLTWGNGYAEIERDNAGRIIWLWPITPDRVKPDRVNRTGRIIYDIHNSGGANTVLEQREMFHLHGLGYDGLQGYSVIAMAAQSIGLGMAAETFGASFFGNGTEPAGVLKHPGALSDTAYNRVKDSWNERHQGPFNARKPAILEEGMSWERISVPPEDAQFLESRKFQVAEICRWYRVPPHMLADLERATFSNIEQQSIEFVQHTLQPWATRIERAINTQILGSQQRGRMYAKISLQALMRGDTAARAAFYNTLFQMGAISPNEVRALEEMNPVPGGDKRFVQLNLTTLDKAGEQPEPAAQPAGLNGTRQSMPDQQQPGNVH